MHATTSISTVPVKYRIAIAIVAINLLVVLGAVRSAVGQQISPKRLLTPELDRAFLAGSLVTHIVEGRLVVTAKRFGNAGGAAKEHLVIRATGTKPAISYQRPGPEGTFSLEVSGSHIEIHNVPKNESQWERVEFLQHGNASISLTVGTPENQKVHTAKSLWHLFVLEPEVCREHLVPLLGPLIRKHDLVAWAKRMETVLVNTTVLAGRPERQRWIELVEQLGDDRFSRREAADRTLREAGAMAVTFLSQLDRAELDAEQHFRIRRIVRDLSKRNEDTPELVASRLATDSAVWLALLSRDEESTRRLAVKQLEALLEREIPFDPAADAETRSRQIEQLRGLVLE